MNKKLMLTLFVTAMLLLCFTAVVPAVPNIMSYQGKLNDRQGNPINGSRNIIFTIYDASSGGNALWSETQDITVTNGILNVELGSSNPIPQNVFNTDNIFLGIRIGTDSEMTPRQRITSGAFTFKSKTSETYTSLLSAIERLTANNLIINEIAGTQADLFIPENMLVLKYDDTSKIIGPINYDYSFSGPSAAWFSPSLRTIYNGVVYDNYSNGVVDTTKWSSNISLTETANTRITGSISGYCGGAERNVYVYVKGSNNLCKIKPTNQSSEFIVRIGGNAYSTNSNSTVSYSLLISDGTNSVYLLNVSAKYYVSSERTIKVRIIGSNAYVKTDNNPIIQETAINLSTLLPGVEWYLFAHAHTDCYGQVGDVLAEVWLYPIVYVNSSNVPPSEVLSAIQNINISSSGHLFDNGNNVYSRSTSFDGGSHFTTVDIGQIFSSNYPGSQAQIRYTLGGNNLETLSRNSLSVLTTNVQ